MSWTTPTQLLTRPRTRLLAASAISVTVAAGMISPASATAATAPSSAARTTYGVNLSTNPELARAASGYSAVSGVRALSRVRVKARGGARYFLRARVTNSTARIAAPRVRVRPGKAVRFALDVKAPSRSSARLSVSWFDTQGRYLGQGIGARRATAPRSWRTVSARLKVPARAAAGQTVVSVFNARRGKRISVAHHSVKIITTSKPLPVYVPGLPTTPTTPGNPIPGRAGLNNSVSQPGAIVWGSASKAVPFQHRGALVVAGRVNYADPEIKAVSAAGGSVLVYLDTIIDNSYGRYHTMLLQSSECGPAVPRWPGSPQANSWGYLNDFRPGSVVQSKLECVLEKIVDENPHIAGFFADDLGSRSWFDGFNWDTFGATNQQNYRDGAIALSKTFRKVADRHGLLFMVNGTWGGGTLAQAGGGYPNSSQSGNALADGTYAEHHSPDGYWNKDYPCSAQWANESPLTNGKAFNFAVATNDSDRAKFAASGCYSFAATQNDYETDVAVWKSFLDVGLPSASRAGS